MLVLHCELPYDLDDPREQGGLIFGTPGHVMSCTGPLPGDDRGTHHLTLCDPGHQLAADLAAASGLRYLGYWHSHPAGTPQGPSEVDIADFREAADLLFPSLPFLDFPIITGGVLRVFRMNHQLELEEVPHELRP
ncbi:Mov34/MPN/PAD-1 family protein [Deinococcus fonticola]|uniref:Mov34/MPN/PAD-1 family protein n=1 Tax=Deinococcus fonticola TaxID=2528713 RepID=UPI001074BD1D|nr:Mov34/MPN/PAD-1 family protein [Deinococcus fonticola]